jgi:hypothetical protein
VVQKVGHGSAEASELDQLARPFAGGRTHGVAAAGDPDMVGTGIRGTLTFAIGQAPDCRRAAAGAAKLRRGGCAGDTASCACFLSDHGGMSEFYSLSAHCGSSIW